jgi:malonyl-CoA O-methyltransferase
MLEKAVHWIKNNTVPNQGIVISSRNKVCYPEVTGYLIPTLLSVGERRLAQQYAQWLVSVQHNDGSFGLRDISYAFDTGQIVRGWVPLLGQMPELERPLRRACDWLVNTADSSSGRLMVPPRSADWSLGTRGQVNEGIHTYVLQPLRQAGELLNEPRYGRFADKSLDYYLKNVNLTDFTQPNALTHFYAYIQEALLELGCQDEARHGMASVAGFQQSTGAVPGYSDVNWVCSTGLAQLATAWYHLGETERADSALAFLEMLQNSTGGFYGSYGPGADYKPAEEISWAAKYAVEAAQRRIAAHFDQTSEIYSAKIAETDGRVQAVLHCLGDLNGKRLLDAGCGKGRYAAIIKQHYPQADVTGMDISAEMLKCVPPGIHTVQNGILNMPFDSDRFDAVICVEALEHVVQIAEGVRELARVLAPGGKLIVIDKNRERLGALKMPSWEKWFAQEELLGLMRANGLSAAAELISHGNATDPDGLFVCWTGQKPTSHTGSVSLVTEHDRKPRRLAVVPSDPLDAYAHKSDEYLRDYFNPTGFFHEVYCLSPLERSPGFRHGMNVIPTGPEQFAQRINQLGIDIVRAYGGYRACDLACQNKVDGVPVVVSVHDKRESWLHDSIHDADYVLSVSNVVRQLLLARGIPSSKIYDFANRVDLQVFHPRSDDKLRAEFCDRYPGRYRILHVGRRAPEKNLDTLIRAVAALGPDYVCISVGKGDDTEYRRLAEQCGVSQRCHFVGSVPHAQLPQYYSFCDCMCTPSRSEGFGLVFIEALACEAVVVTSNIAPMNEYITNGVSGILVEDLEPPTALAEAIVRACADQQLRSTIRSNARKAAEPFSKDKIDLREANLYRQFLNAHVPTTRVNAQVRENILINNPWYVGSQFEWAEKTNIKRIYDKRYNFFIECINRAKERLGRKLRVLDAGCGDGYWLWRLHDLQQVELTGIDYNPLRVQRAGQVVPDVAVYHSDLMDFCSEEPFDVILLSQVVEHVENDVELLKRIRTLLHEDGTLIVGTTNEGSHLHQEKIMRLGDKFVTDHVHFYTEQEVVSKLQQAGFSVDNIMREAFYLGDDALYYNLLETQWGFELLELLTFLVPSGCSDYYFECSPKTATSSSEKKSCGPQPPAVQEIIPKVNRFGEQIKVLMSG